MYLAVHPAIFYEPPTAFFTPCPGQAQWEERGHWPIPDLCLDPPQVLKTAGAMSQARKEAPAWPRTKGAASWSAFLENFSPLDVEYDFKTSALERTSSTPSPTTKRSWGQSRSLKDFLGRFPAGRRQRDPRICAVTPWSWTRLPTTCPLGAAQLLRRAKNGGRSPAMPRPAATVKLQPFSGPEFCPPSFGCTKLSGVPLNTRPRAPPTAKASA